LKVPTIGIKTSFSILRLKVLFNKFSIFFEVCIDVKAKANSLQLQGTMRWLKGGLEEEVSLVLCLTLAFVNVV